MNNFTHTNVGIFKVDWPKILHFSHFAWTYASTLILYSIDRNKSNSMFKIFSQ